MRGSITTLICGAVMFINRKIHMRGYTKREKSKNRNPKINKTTEQQAAVNTRQAADKLLALIHTNFKGGDLHIIPTYSEENYPYSTEEIKRRQTNFVRRLKYAYNKLGEELKYIQVTEYEETRTHHHYIINKVDGITIDDIQNIWGDIVRYKPLEKDGYYKKLADYLIKETSKSFRKKERVYAKRWTASKNLKKPEKHTETVKIKNEYDFLTAPLSDGDYELIKESEFLGVNEFTGVPYLTYAMKKINTAADNTSGGKKRRRGSDRTKKIHTAADNATGSRKRRHGSGSGNNKHIPKPPPDTALLSNRCIKHKRTDI